MSDTQRFSEQIAFLLEMDKMKNIYRQTRVLHEDRAENDAEHAWHMAVMAYLLKEYANETVDISRVMIMCLIHDIVEIDAGDTYAYDPEAAKALLAEAGYPDGCTITATIRSQDQPDMIQIQSDLAQVGITMNINIVDAAVWTSERAAGNVQCLWMGWYPLYADADNNIYSFFYSTYAAGKSVFYNNPEFDALMDEARISVDDAERQKLYEQADEILSRVDYGSVPLYYPYRVFAAQDYVTNFTVGNLIYHVAYDVDFDMDIYNAQK